jgi:hypothetical protein
MCVAIIATGSVSLRLVSCACVVRFGHDATDSVANLSRNDLPVLPRLFEASHKKLIRTIVTECGYGFRKTLASENAIATPRRGSDQTAACARHVNVQSYACAIKSILLRTKPASSKFNTSENHPCV